ncbi:metallophosphoesterase [Aequorivita capsosiphonis]|uniref:metallophosphoesterase n=1 Tax=Aequorivita capsosiphonis TaxID=487317 RepID=UPI000418CE2E|nr:metallophosphoesterase [Aequorivita capsosiphonis]
MIKKILTLILSIASLLTVFGQEVKSEQVINDSIITKLNDGPYIFIKDNQLIEKNIIDGKVVSKKLQNNAYDTIYKPEKSVFNNVMKVAALSDIHGQYDLAVEILKNNKIIDKDLNWNFGKGHLVIVGDIFDRGPKVNQMLWLTYKLEHQAKAKGGDVHFIFGNHEYMIFLKDFRYVNEKYLAVSKLLNRDYNELYGEDTVLGRWLRSKPTILKINDNIYLHGGISEEFLAQVDFDIEAINNTMRQSNGRSKEDMKTTDFYKTYYGSTGPIWYRGYFKNDLDDEQISNILKQTNAMHIIVGHTTHDSIVSLYDNRIFGVDSRIKKGENGEILFIINNNFSRGTKEGSRIKF